MVVDLCTAVQFLHVSASIALNGFNERDVLVYSLSSTSKGAGARLRLSLANICREHEAASSPPASLQLGMRRDVESLGCVCTSILSVLQLKQAYRGPNHALQAWTPPSLSGAHVSIAQTVRAAMGMAGDPVLNIVDVSDVFYWKSAVQDFTEGGWLA
jgi:hypothetical protein